MIYLDNAATTPLRPEVRDAMLPWLGERFANPSSIHSAGASARRAVEEARRTLAAALDVSPEAVVFTSGGTEANNLAVRGLLLCRPPGKRHAVATAVEHPSVREALRTLEPLGVEITWIRPQPSGRVDPDEILAAVRPETGLVAVIHGQNEYGTLQPIREIAARLARQHPPVPLHADAVQSFGKVALRPREIGAATLSLSAHKIHGPKGAGALVVLSRREMWPLLAGGGQERGLRSGTENVAAIAGFARAVELAGDVTRAGARMSALLDRLLKQVSARIPRIRVLAEESDRLPHIAALAIEGVLGEVLVHHLDAEGIAISRGSACQATKKEISPSLAALGLEEGFSRRVIRISLSTHNTDAEVDHLVDALERSVTALRCLGD